MARLPLLLFFLIFVFSVFPQDSQALLLLKDTVFNLSNTNIDEASREEGILWKSLLEWLASQPLPYKEISLSDSLLGHSFSRMIQVSDGREPQIIFFFPINGRRAALNALIAVELIEILRNEPFGVPFVIVFAGAEDPENFRQNLGLSFFLRNLQFPEKKAMIYIEGTGNPKNVLQTIVRGTSSPVWMIRSLFRASLDTEFPLEVKEIRPSFFRFFLEGRESPVDAVISRGLRVLRLSWNEADYERVPLLLAKWHSYFSNSIPDDWDKHYVMFGQSPNSLILDQRSYVIFLVFCVSLITFLIIQFPHAVRQHIDAFRGGYWQIGVYFSLFFFFNFFATLGVELFNNSLKQVSDPWREYPLLFLLWKLFFVFVSYLIFIIWTRRLPLYRWSVFYESAVVFLYASFAVIALGLNFGFSFFFIWSLFLAILFIVIPWRPFKLIIILLIPLWPFYSLVMSLIQDSDFPLLRSILFSPIEGNLVITLYMLPLVFLIFAYHFEHHQRLNSKEHLRVLGLFMLSGLGLIITSLMILLQPYQQEKTPRVTEIFNKQMGISMIDTVDLTGDMVIELATRLGAKIIQKEENSFQLERDLVPPARIEFQGVSEFLNRYRYNYLLRTVFPASKIKISLQSFELPLVVLDSNFPYEQLDQGLIVNFHIGRNPPLQIPLNFTLQGNHRLRLKISVNFVPHPQLVAKGGTNWETSLNFLEERIIEQ
jgi:hypothetical protein